MPLVLRVVGLALRVPLGLAVALLSRPAAAGGFEYPSNGTRALGRGGAFTVRADDLSAMYFNPAGLAKLHGTHTLLNLNMTWEHIRYRRSPAPRWRGECPDPTLPECQLPVVDPNDPNSDGFVHFDAVENSAAFFPYGASFGVATDFGLHDWTFAAGVFGPSAVGKSEFPETGPQRFLFVRKDMLLLYPTVSVAWAYEDIVGVGVSFHLMTMPTSTFALVIDGYQERTIWPVASEWEVLADLEFSDPVRFTMTIGSWYRPFKFLEFGVSALVVPIHVVADGRVSVEPLPATEGTCQSDPPALDDPCQKSIIYGKPFVMSDDRVRLEFSMPLRVSGGVRYIHWYQGRELFDIELDVHWEGWSSIDQFSVHFAEGATIDVEVNPDTGEHQVAELNDITLEKRWKDTWSVRLGGDVNVVPDILWLRIGGFFETGAVPEAYSNLDFLSFQRWGIGGGFSVVPIPGLEISASYLHIFQEDRNLAEDESKVFQQRPAAYCDASTGYAAGPEGDPRCDTRSYYDGLPGAPVGGGRYESSLDVLSVGVRINWDQLL